MSLLRVIASGAAWMTAGAWLAQILQLGVSIVLARLLSPQDYGLASMSVVFTGFVALFSNLGLGQALVQRQEIDDDYIDTAFWGTAAVAVALFLAAIGTAPLVAVFFGEPRLTDIVRVTSIGLLLSPLNVVLVNLLKRRMAFREVAIVDFLCALGSQITALTTAFLGWGVWSLVLGSLAHQFVRMPALLFLNRWFPRLRFSAERFQKLFSFGSNLLGFNFLNYIARNLDNVIIGRFLGAAQLGYYDLAYQLMLKVLSNVSHTLSGAVFPVLSSVQHDKERVAEIYRSVVSYISLITFPVMVGISLVAPEFVLGVLGEKWAPAIDVVRVLGLVGAIQSVSGLVSDVFLSQGRSDLMLKWALVATPGAALAFWLGVRWGIVGVALCYLLFTLLAWVGSHALGFRLVGLSARRYLSGLVPASKACLVMVVTVFAARLMLAPWGASEVTELVILVAVGATVYTTTMWFERVEEVAKVRDSILAFAQRRLPRFLQPDRKTEIL